MHRLNMIHRAGALVLAIAVLAGCAPADSAALIAEARQQHGRGELRAAVIGLKNALRQRDDVQARRLLGEVYLDQGDALSAEKELRRALAGTAEGEAAQLRALLGRALLLQGQFERVIKEFPGQDAATLTLRGDALAGLGKLDAAKAAYLAASAHDPRSADAMLGQARIAVLEKRLEDADALVGRALAARPGHIASLRFRGDRLRASNRPREALASYQQILALRPEDAQANTDMAGIYSDAGKFERAREAIAQARKAAGNTLGVHYARALLGYREGKPAEALEAVQQILRVAPEHPAALLLAATVELRMDALESAERHLRTYLARHPDDLYAGKRMAYLELKSGRTEAALQRLAPLTASHPQDIELLTLAGEANLRARRYNEAAELFERASALQPNVAQLHTEVALSRLGNGEHARAIAELERAAQLDGRSERNGILLVMAHLRADAPDKALEAARAMERRADNPLVQNLKGGVYLAARDSASARKSFERALALDAAYLPALANLAQLDKAAGRPQDALRRYRAALERPPGHPGLLQALAELETENGRHREAAAWLERAHQARPEDVALALRLAEARQRAGQPDKALLLVRRLAATHPGDPDVLQAAGDLQWQVGDLAGAHASYVKLAALRPAAPLTHLRLASLALARGDAGAATSALNKVLSLAPDSFDAQLTLSNILVAQKQYGQALALAATVRQRQPKSPHGYKLEADVHTAQGKHALALPGYERAFALAPSGAALMQLHATLLKLGRPALADQHMQQWLRERPKDLPTRIYYASSKMVAGDFPGAIRQFEQVLKIDPDNVVALNDAAWAHQQLGQKEALAYARRAYRLAPANPSVIDTLGWIYWQNGDAARAVPLLRKAAALAPAQADIQSHLAAALSQSSRAGSAPAR